MTKLKEHLPISVIIPVFNCEAYISNAIDSVLRQGIRPAEIIVIDDGSTDRTAEICATYKKLISYYYKNNEGEGSARNLGFQKSQNRLLAFLDADDMWLPNALESLKKPFLFDNKALLSIGYSQEIVKIENEWKSDRKPYIGVQLSAMMVRREAFELVGLFNENLKLAVDTDWLFRVRENNLVIKYVTQTVTHYRRHVENASLCNDLLEASLLTACRTSLERRRTQGLDLFLPTYGYRRSNL